MLDYNLSLQCSVIVSKNGEAPILELRRKIVDIGILREVVYRALHEQPIIILPKFTDRMRSIASLIENGVIYYDKEKNQYFFKE